MTRSSISRLADCAPVASLESWPERKPPMIPIHPFIRFAVQDAEPTPPVSTEAGRTGSAHLPTAAKDVASTFGAAFDAACDELKAQAARTVRRVIKDRARAYALRPRDLEALADGLIDLSPRDLTTALSLIGAVYKMRGLAAINLPGALLYARYLRAKARKIGWMA